MTKAHLIRKTTDEPVGAVLDTSRPQWLRHPDNPKRALCGPAAIGWEDDEFRLCVLVEAEAPPAGKQRVGTPQRTYDDVTKKVVEVYVLADVSKQPDRTDAEKINEIVTQFGFSDAKALREALDAEAEEVLRS